MESDWVSFLVESPNAGVLCVFECCRDSNQWDGWDRAPVLARTHCDQLSYNGELLLLFSKRLFFHVHQRSFQGRQAVPSEAFQLSKVHQPAQQLQMTP